MVDTITPVVDPTGGIAKPAVDPKIAVDKAKADKIAADKVIADREAKAEIDGTKVLGDMERAMGDRLRKMHDEMGAEFSKADAAFYDMPSEIREHHLYKSLGEKFASVEALLTTLKITADTFPMPDAAVTRSTDPHWKGPAHLEEPHIEGTMGTPPAPPIPATPPGPSLPAQPPLGPIVKTVPTP